jgi:hypothetical protein
MINMRPDVEDRNQQIWMLRFSGVPVVEIAAGYGLSPKQIYRICDQVAAEIPEETREGGRKRQAAFYDQLLRQQMEIANRPAKPSYAANGRELVDRDGEPIRDHSEILAAHDRALKTAALRAKLFGLDAPTQQQHSVTVTAEVQAATQRDAALVDRRLGRLALGAAESPALASTEDVLDVEGELVDPPTFQQQIDEMAAKFPLLVDGPSHA